MTIEGVILYVCFGCYMPTNHGPNMVETSLDFRGNADKRLTKKGAKPIIDKCMNLFHDII